MHKRITENVNHGAEPWERRLLADEDGQAVTLQQLLQKIEDLEQNVANVKHRLGLIKHNLPPNWE